MSVGQLYDGLGIPRGASKSAVKSRYFVIAKTLHPDAPSGSNEKFALATDIYQRLLKIAPEASAADDFLPGGKYEGWKEGESVGLSRKPTLRKPAARGGSAAGGYDPGSERYAGASAQEEARVSSKAQSAVACGFICGGLV